jgi:hypothetical protein
VDYTPLFDGSPGKLRKNTLPKGASKRRFLSSFVYITLLAEIKALQGVKAWIEWHNFNKKSKSVNHSQAVTQNTAPA